MLRAAARPLLAEAATATASTGAAAAAASAGADAAARGAAGRFVRPPPARPPLGERYDAPGYPKHSLNIKYSSLIVGQHFDRVVFDKRTQMMALLSACNLIRETLSQEGRILLHTKDPELQADMLAAARDCGEFTHYGKWPPGGFTNRPQVSAVPTLPSLVIMMEHDNHVLLREAFQMCIPRVAPVDVYNNKADATPEVPLHAARMSVPEKRKMLGFLSGFIAKLKFGAMPIQDTNGRFKEFVAREWGSYNALRKDLPEPYVKAATRLYDERPAEKYGIDPVHAAYNEKRAFEQSLAYNVGALQSSKYRDASETQDDALAENPPPIEEWDFTDAQEYTELSDPYIHKPEDIAGGYVHQIDPVSGRPLGRVAELNNRDFETEEFEARALAAKAAGVKFARDSEEVTQSDAAADTRQLDENMRRASDVEARELYENWLKDRQDQANDTIPYAKEHEAKLSSNWSVPGEDLVQKRLFALKNRVREQREYVATHPEVQDEEDLAEEAAVAAPKGKDGKAKTRFVRPRRVDSALEGTPLDPEEGTEQQAATRKLKAVWASRKTGRLTRDFEAEVGEIWDDQERQTIDGYTGHPIVSVKERDAGAAFAQKQPSGAAGGQRRNFSTYRRTASAAVAATADAASASPAAPTPSWWRRLPGWVWPALLATPLVAFWASSKHASETDVVELQKQSPVARALVAAPAGSVPSADQARLAAAESRLQLLQQSHAFVLESIAASERQQHSAVLAEFDAQESELRAEIEQLKQAPIKAQLEAEMAERKQARAKQQHELAPQGGRYVVGHKKE